MGRALSKKGGRGIAALGTLLSGCRTLVRKPAGHRTCPERLHDGWIGEDNERGTGTSRGHCIDHRAELQHRGVYSPE